MGLLVSCSNLFFYCYFGKYATESYEKMADCLYESSWAEHPIHVQKYFIVMIMNTQRPLYYHGFGIAVLNLETFTSVREFWNEGIENNTKLYFANVLIFSWLRNLLLSTWCSRHLHQKNVNVIEIRKPGFVFKYLLQEQYSEDFFNSNEPSITDEPSLVPIFWT